MPRGLPISTFVDVSTAIQAGGVLRTEFGTGLLVTTDDALPAGGSAKAQVFRDIDAVNAVFDAGDAFDGASVWFSADPSPKSLYIGRWAPTDVSTVVMGGTPAAVSAIAVANGSFRVGDDDVTVNLSSASTYAAIASAIETSLATGGISDVNLTAMGSGYATAPAVGFTGGGGLGATATATISGTVSAIAVATGGSGYVGGTTTATITGGGGSGATASATVLLGVVTAIAVTNGGAGYSGAPTVTIVDSGGGGTGATATATISAEVTTVTVTAPGTGYSSAPTVTFTGGGGTGAAATALLSDIALQGATFAYTGNVFVLTLAGAENVGFFRAHSAGTGTDISGLLGMTAAADGVNRPGHDAESVTDAIGEMVGLASGSTPVALMLADDAPLVVGAADTREAVAAYAQAGDYVFGLLDTSAQALVPGDSVSHSAMVFSRGQSHVDPTYSATGRRPDIGLLALLSSQDLNQPASIITPHLKTLPGVSSTNITETQRLELQRKRTNVYTDVGGLPSLVGGYTGRAGSWADAVWWLLWLKNEVELSVFNAQRASRRFNTAILTDTLTQNMRTAVQSGGAQPGGRVNAGVRDSIRSVTGNYEFDGTLTAGYLIWVEQQSARSDLDRENRIGRFRIWVAPADAIHQVVGTIILSG